MKKILNLILIVLVGAAISHAAPVNMNRAGSTALSFAKMQKEAASNMSVKSVMKINDGIFLVNLSPRGFVLVSSDDCATPIMGYSMTGNLDPEYIPENMGYMVDESSLAVTTTAKRGVANSMWSQIERGRIMSRAEGEEVDPLISVNWNQGDPYNKYCPGTGSKKAVVGCVAVAMSQAMSVQRYPEKPQGYVSFSCPGYGELTIDFDKQQPYDWDKIMKGTSNFDETARLLYHAGMSVNMDYGADGSGIPSNQVYRITNAFKQNFGYGNDINYHWRSSYSGDWEQLLLNELYAGRAIVYNAVDSKGGYGHSFNLDGFRDGFFHVNWGWGGYGNAYFKVSALKDAMMGMNYDDYHVAVVGIGAANSAFKSIFLSENYVEVGQPVGAPVCLLQVNGEKPDLSKMTISLTGEWDRNTSSYKDTPFKYENGKLVTTRAISLDEESFYVRVQVQLKDGSNAKLTQGFNIKVEQAKPIESRTSLKYDRNTGEFTLHSKFGTEITVLNSNGTAVAKTTLDESPYFTFNRSILTDGDNKIELKTAAGTKYVTIKK